MNSALSHCWTDSISSRASLASSSGTCTFTPPVAIEYPSVPSVASSWITSAMKPAASRRERTICASARLNVRNTVTGPISSSGFNFREHNPTRAGLEQARHLHIDGLADERRRVIHDHHGAIVHVADSL